jgi:precorrin-3B methylase
MLQSTNDSFNQALTKPSSLPNVTTAIREQSRIVAYRSFRKYVNEQPENQIIHSTRQTAPLARAKAEGGRRNE